MKLYDYFRSTASYRVRIALNLKQLPHEKIPIHLVLHGGEQHQPAYRKMNPQGLVPSLTVDHMVLSQSLAIIEYLDEIAPDPPLLPELPIEKATVRMLAQMIACDIHPLNNLRVLNRLKEQFKADEEQKLQWYHHWLKIGFEALEARLQDIDRTVPVCFGDKVSLADLCLVPQVYNAKRFALPLDDFPLIQQINEHCLTKEAFYMAAPQDT
ncbi:maleylacetoacetate isomerase [Legionella israelensis]|uniref:maleylacetoacetate isomerase n=1 Tax=Legionella israelensis TaxID=454 RepID=UPI0007308766|nr:maleylacetoacetate isomerase [Legionella israelensis]QBS11123.1 maleylacetoacetate isomerase [Legionella israelensis]QDP73532.1 maleylacetoacetate isomerase [Legionella israelensis]